MKQHQDIRKGIRDFSCKICGGSFNKRGNIIWLHPLWKVFYKQTESAETPVEKYLQILDNNKFFFYLNQLQVKAGCMTKRANGLMIWGPIFPT